MKQLFRPLGELTDRAVCALGAVALSQLPVYMHQYLNVLSGALTEAKINIQDIEKRAADVSLTLQEFIQHHLASEDPVFKQSGLHFQEQLQRYEGYKTAFESLTQANIWEKPFIFAKIYNAQLGEAVQFVPNLPLNLEGAVYAGAGLLLGFILMKSLAWLLGKLLGAKTEAPNSAQ